MFCLPETGPVHPCSFFRLILRDKGQFVSEEGYLSNNETCKTKNLPLNVLSWLPAKSEALNRKYLPGPSLCGRRWIKRKDDGLLPWGKNSRIFFVVVIYAVGKWIDSERDGLWNTTGVVLCVYMCAYTTTERLRNVWSLLLRWVLRKYKIALEDEEGPGSGKQVWGDTDRGIAGSARAVRREFFFFCIVRG